MAAPSPQRGTAADRESSETQHRHPDGARTEHGALVRREYSLLAPAEPAGDPDSVGTQVSRGGYESTMGTDDQYQRATETGDGTGQRALLVRNMPVDKNEERSPLERQRALNACGHQGGEGGEGPLTLQRAPTACI